MEEAEWLASADPAAMLAHVRGKVSARKLRLFACAVCRSCWGLFTDERSRRAVEVAELYADGATSAAALHRACQDAMPLLWVPHGTARERLAADAAVWACARDLRLPANPGAMTWRALTDLLPPADQAALLRDLVGNPWQPGLLCGGREFACSFCAGTGAAFEVDAVCGGAPPSNPRPAVCMCCEGTGRQTHASEQPCGLCREILTPAVLSLARAAYEERGGWACGHCDGRGDGIYGLEETEWECERCESTGRTGEGFLDPARLAVLSDALEEAGCEEVTILEHLRSPGPHTRGCWATDLLLGRE